MLPLQNAAKDAQRYLSFKLPEDCHTELGDELKKFAKRKNSQEHFYELMGKLITEQRDGLNQLHATMQALTVEQMQSDGQKNTKEDSLAMHLATKLAIFEKSINERLQSTEECLEKLSTNGALLKDAEQSLAQRISVLEDNQKSHMQAYDEMLLRVTSMRQELSVEIQKSEASIACYKAETTINAQLQQQADILAALPNVLKETRYACDAQLKDEMNSLRHSYEHMRGYLQNSLSETHHTMEQQSHKIYSIEYKYCNSLSAQHLNAAAQHLQLASMQKKIDENEAQNKSLSLAFKSIVEPATSKHSIICSGLFEDALQASK